MTLTPSIPAVEPAPYLARAKWVPLKDDDALPDEAIKDYITEAHKIIVAKLTQKMQRELGL